MNVLRVYKPNDKRKWAVIFISLYVIFSFACCWKINAFSVTAEEGGVSQEELDKTIIEQLDKLDLRDLQAYLDSLGEYSDKSVVERIVEHIRGGEFDYDSFGNELGEILFAKVSEILPAFACITAVTLLSGIISTLKSGSGGQTSSEMIFLITYAAALIPLLGVLTEVMKQSFTSVSNMQKQMQIVFPIMLTLMAASGSTVSAAVCRPAVAFFSTSIVSVIHSVVFPLTVTIILFSLAGGLTKELKIGKFTAFFKSINKWIIGVCISVFGIFFTLQGITSATYDGVVRRAAKYAIGNGIPIVGGFLSGGFDLAVAGGILIKNSLGSMSIFLMFSILFEPLVLLISVNLLLRLVSAITQPFGDSRISDFLGETAENLHYCTASLLFTAFLYFLSIMVMIFSTEALF